MHREKIHFVSDGICQVIAHTDQFVVDKDLQWFLGHPLRTRPY